MFKARARGMCTACSFCLIKDERLARMQHGAFKLVFWQHYVCSLHDVTAWEALRFLSHRNQDILRGLLRLVDAAATKRCVKTTDVPNHALLEQ